MRRCLVLSLLAAGTTLCQPASVLPDNPQFQMSGAPASYLSQVAVTGQPFTTAWHVRGERSTNVWDIRMRCFTTAAARVGDIVRVRFWMRTTQSASGTGYTTFVAERNDSPYTKSVSYTVLAGSEWKKIEFPFAMAEDYNANQWNLSFWVTFDPQEIEIGGLSVMNEGQPDGTSWRAAALERIEKIRKADIAVVVRDADGAPLRNASVHVRMKKHAFGFGTAVANTPLTGTSVDALRYQQELKSSFNMAVTENELKWPDFEANRQRAANMLDWLRQNGITNIRGHNLIWPGKEYLPNDVVAMLNAPPVDQAALRARINNHFTDVMHATVGKTLEWDVLNEPCTNRDVQAVLGNAEMAEWFKTAHAIDPAQKLFVNDYNIVASGYDLTKHDTYYNIIQDLIDRGAPVGGIGLQGHFSPPLTAPARALEILDRFAQFGKDLEITEFDINTTDEQLQGDYTRDFLTLCFSHPAMKSFLVWGFWEGAIWKASGAMMRRDWSAKPNYTAWRDLIYNQWWTDVEGAPGADGVFRTRGFLGEYEVDITVDGVKQTLPLMLAAGQTNYVTLRSQTPGSIAAGGIVNAASLAGGAVAPGEMVQISGAGFGSASYASGKQENSQLAGEAGDTRVYFNGVAAPVVSSAAGVVRAVVPYAASGSTSVEVEYLGTKSNAVSVPVVAAAPGIFCYNGGSGQAVALSGTTFNAVQSTPKGGTLTFYITGGGQTTPAGADGRIPATGSNLKPAQSVVVKIGGVESGCESNWIGQVMPGVMQVNACVPAGAPSGTQVPLEVTVGGVASQSGVTVRIQ